MVRAELRARLLDHWLAGSHAPAMLLGGGAGQEPGETIVRSEELLIRG